MTSLRGDRTTPSALVDAAPVMIWSASAGRVCTYFNRPWLDYRGRMLQEEIGSGWTQGVHPDDLRRCLEAYDANFQQRRSFQVDYRLRRHDAAYRWVLEYGAPRFTEHGRFMGYVGACVDIQDRKIAEQALEASVTELRRHKEELMEFAYGASHDLQEPLRTVASYAHLLARRCDHQNDREMVEFLGFILSGIKRMQALIKELLNYSSLLEGSSTQITDLDCNAIFEEAMFACQAAAQETEAVITHDSLPMVRADRAQLVQVLQNLLSNAIKYRKPLERPRIHVSAANEGEEWVFQVADNGIGFETQYAERIFGLFKRLHGGEYGGSGLGLGICKKIIERYGGRIWANSQPGCGSQFFFSLPKV
ncbi:MAG TPA: ATP-binding protein [Candidatus Acidoferrum sp.]|nr:ATP-binding protein [Candidatus Acidoferrum sp.]